MSVGSLTGTRDDQKILLFPGYKLDGCAWDGGLNTALAMRSELLSLPSPPCLFAITDGVWCSRE